VTEDHRLRLAFAGLHPEQVERLLSEGSARRALAKVENGQIGSPVARAAARVPADQRRRELERLGITVVFRGGPGYPEALQGRQNAPDSLFVRGSVAEGPAVAVVGTRRCTIYGRRLARSYGRAVAKAGWPLVSGLARGVDGAAHEGTVDVAGQGIAVLGSGIDVLYPAEHRALAQQLVDNGGAIVTEYPPGTPPEGWRFPPRNRIISGLSGAVVVVEATVKGGALITASAALEQGIPVFSVPGDVDRDSSRGCNLLIRDGAHPVLDPDDLVEELELVLGPAPRGRRRGGVPADVDLPNDVIAAIEGIGVGQSVDEFAARAGVDAVAALVLVGLLEANGLVCREGSLLTRAP
jgi:DNA processing protein